MNLIFICVCYVGLHFTTYALVGRHLIVLRTERGIFTYHAFSYLLALMLAGLTVFLQPSAETLILGGLLAGLHGIYSLTFLEVWSLTQGSYSLQLLSRIAQCGPVAAAELPGGTDIGSQKQQDRASVIRRLGFARTDGRLTTTGRIVVQILRGILWLSKGKPLN